MNYHNITVDDMLNGDGLRTVLWVSGCMHHCRRKIWITLLSFPIRTVTVGSGIAPDRPKIAQGFMDYTIGRDLHPAPKTIQF